MTQTHTPIFLDKTMDELHQRVLKKGGPLSEMSALHSDEYFWNLCESIIGQQLSEKVAPQIVARVKTVLKDVLTPENVLVTPDAALRAAGMSFAKISYVKNVAQAWTSGLIDPTTLNELGDEEVIERLVTIKGVGRWTAEMFLIFTLGRSDVFSVGDYGLRRAILLAYQLPAETTPKQILALSESWRPNRSLASRLLWKSLDLF